LTDGFLINLTQFVVLANSWKVNATNGVGREMAQGEQSHTPIALRIRHVERILAEWQLTLITSPPKSHAEF